MVSRIDSTRIMEQTRARPEPADGEAARSETRSPVIADGDVRLSLSEAAKRLSGDSIAFGEASRRNDRPGTDHVVAPASSLPAEIGERASDGPGAMDERANERVAGSAVYRTPTRSEVGARISLRV